MDDDISDPVIAAAAAAGDDDYCDVETWEILKKRFAEAQWLLDRNRQLIQQINDNQRSGIPQNMSRNVDLMSKLDSNTKKLVQVYSNVSVNVSAVVQGIRAKAEAAGKNVAL